ncbi:MAG: hypothetical protein SNJ70_04305 [Armatimonadota bacterium]
MKSIAWGTILWVFTGIFVLVGSFSLAGWMIYQVVNPWVISLIDIQRIQKNGPTHYVSNWQTDKLYQKIQDIVSDISSERYESAINKIDFLEKSNPDNSLYAYLKAAISQRQNDIESAFYYFKIGNNRQSLILYSPKEFSGYYKIWPEYDIIEKAIKDISSRNINTKEEVFIILEASQNLLWAEPADFNRIRSALTIRDKLTDTLLEISESENDRAIVEKIKSEKKKAIVGISKRKDLIKKSRSISKAWAISRALERNDEEYNKAVILLTLEMQSEIGKELRDNYMDRNILNNK